MYEALRTGPGWPGTLLVITYDEHGGCYDHVPPPWGAVPPDNDTGEFGFGFDRFGVRVPTVLVSPLIEAGTVFRVPAGGTPLDHTSILKTVEQRWNLPELTARDMAAPWFGDVLTLTTPRTDDVLALVDVPVSSGLGPAAETVSHPQSAKAELLSQQYLQGTSAPTQAGATAPGLSASVDTGAAPAITVPGERNRGFSGRQAKLFISYSHRDERYLKRLEIHLASLRREGVIAEWNDLMIVPGEQWRMTIGDRLESADCVLLLVTPDFIASDYCYSVEMGRALERHREGRALVLPVIVRPADWQHTPLGELQALPKDGRPIVEWADKDRAWLEVTSGLRRALADPSQ